MIKKNILLLIVLLVSLIISDHFLYRLILAPRLETMSDVPLFWDILVFSPLILFFVFAGFQISSIFELIIFSPAIAVGIAGYEQVVSIMNQPGHLKSFSVEASFYFWTVNLGIYIVLNFVALGLGWGAAFLIRFLGRGKYK